MPKTSIEYSKTIIYKIVCNDLNITDLYVGHTTDFTKRKYQHKSNCNNANSKSYNYKVYKMIRENEGWDNWSMIEIEKYTCDDSNEAGARERYWYEMLNANLNTQCPKRSQKEYHENNKEILNQKSREYRENNKETISQKKSEKFTCSCGSILRMGEKARHLQTSKHQTYCNSTILDV